MKKLIIPFALVANFLLVGCGGGSSYSYGDDDLPTPTAELKQKQTTSVLDKIVKTKLDPLAFAIDFYEGSNRVIEVPSNSKRLTGQYSAKENRENSCQFGGSIEEVVISGKSEDEDNESTSGSKKYKLIYKDCEVLPKVTLNGTVNSYETWKREDENIISYTGSYSSENFVYQKDENHKIVIRYTQENKGKYCESYGKSNVACYEEGTSVYKFNGNMVENNETLEFKNIKREKEFRINHEEPYEYYQSFKLSGAIKSLELGGWIVIETPTKFEMNEKDEIEDKNYCWHKGKLVVRGAKHTLTQEVYSNHSIVQKFDNKVVKKYTNCKEYWGEE